MLIYASTVQSGIVATRLQSSTRVFELSSYRTCRRVGMTCFILTMLFMKADVIVILWVWLVSYRSKCFTFKKYFYDVILHRLPSVYSNRKGKESMKALLIFILTKYKNPAGRQGR